MIRISPAILIELEQSTHVADVQEAVQKAIELEHSTIPPYLTAEFSLMPGHNEEVRKIIHFVAVEEMLHFSLACNILNALGGNPRIYHPDFVINYPGPLPLGIANSLKVGLEKATKKLINDVFLEIEEPENPLNFPVERFGLSDKEFTTIGQFYEAIKQKILELPHDTLPGNPALQVDGFFPPQHLFKVVTKADAIRAIDIIVDQGEGTSTTPIGKDDELAHYYKFKQVVVGKRLVRQGGSFSYSGTDITLDESKVYPLYANTKMADIPAGSAQHNQLTSFNHSYSRILKHLHEAFNGMPEKLGDSIGEMFTLSVLAADLVAMEFPGKPGVTVGPSFEFMQI